MRYFLLLAIMIFPVACNQVPETAKGKTVSVSILPEKTFVEAIAGNLVNVNVMIPPGASHSTYEPTARQMNRLVSSQAYFRIGHLDFELSWMPRFEGINQSMKVYDLSEGIELIYGTEHHHDGDAHQESEQGIDPHVWMSPKNVRIIASNILKSLDELYPADSAAFRKNYDSFKLRVDSIDSLFNSNMKTLHGRSFIIYHPALAYLARDYNMEQVVLEYEGKEPPMSHIKAIIDLAREKNIHIVFVQKQISIDNSRTLAQEIDGKIIPIDPLDPDWETQMKYILNLILSNTEIQK